MFNGQPPIYKVACSILSMLRIEYVSIFLKYINCSNKALFCYLSFLSCFNILFSSFEQVKHNFLNLSKPSFCSKGSKSVSFVALVENYRAGRIEIRVSTTSIFINIL